MKTSRIVAYAGIIGALYCVLVIGLAPISYDILQLRMANVLKALAIVRPEFAFGFAIGNFIANQASPFGILDWGIMPFFDVAGALIAYHLRKRIWFAVLAQSAIIATGVATFPLGLGAHLPWLPAFLSVFLSSVLVIGIGAIILVPALKAAYPKLWQ
jgi:uncharacterized membrane protein